jgi:chromosome segregation ATPase
LKEIEANKKKDKREANKLLGEFGLSLQDPDGDGVVDNWEEIQDAMWDEYNSHINDAGEVIDMDEDEWADYEEAWQDAMDALNQYEETMALAQEQQNALEEMLNELSDLNAEKITYVVETKLELNDADIELLEYFQDKYEDSLENQDQYFSSLMQNAQKEMDSIAAIRQGMADLDAAYQMTAGLEGEALKQAIENGGITLATWQEEMTNLNSDLLDKLSTLQDLKEQMGEMYGQALELALDRLEEQIGYLDSISEAMGSFRELSMAFADGTSSSMLEGLQKFFDIEKQANAEAM